MFDVEVKQSILLQGLPLTHNYPNKSDYSTPDFAQDQDGSRGGLAESMIL